MILFSQSNHTGIETLNVCVMRIWKLTLNRTTLELKRFRTIFSYFFPILSIEPHWNWNIPIDVFIANPNTSQSNHTGIETIESSLYPPLSPPLNRTTLELKLHNLLIVSQFLLLSIEPHWNWNPSCRIEVAKGFDSQSNHTGIETKNAHTPS